MERVRDFAIQIETELCFQEAIDKTTELLKEQGFGILTEIDVKVTLKNKLDLDYKPYTILGACNPSFAHRTLDAVPHIGVLLPCNVVIWDEGDKRVISAMEPTIMSKLIDNPVVSEVALKVSKRLQEVLEKLENM